jgi:uroporphyrin-3 C-methyltransferase
MTDLPKSPDDKNKQDLKNDILGKDVVDSSAEPLLNESTREASKPAKIDTPKSPQKQSEHTMQNSAPESSNQAPAKTGLLWFFTLVNIIAIALLAAGGYWYYTQISQNEANKASVNAQVEQQLMSLQNAQQRASATVSSDVQKIASTQQDQAQSIDSVLAQVLQNAETNQALQKRLAEMAGRRPSDWLLAEANYLVNMAGRKLYLEKDIRTAVTLLQEADARLDDLNDPALFPVRALIAADIQTLRAINSTSTSSIALAISGMLPSVSALPLDVLQLPETAPQEDLTLSEDISDWRENLSRTWRSIVGDAVTVSDLNAPLEPYLAERQQWLIEQQLKHALAQAQSAVLDEQQALYAASMQTAIGLLVEHYKLDDAGVGQFVNALQELQNADFTRNLPNKLESQASLKDILELRVQSLYNNMPTSEDNSNAEGSQL